MKTYGGVDVNMFVKNKIKTVTRIKLDSFLKPMEK
jgi:hypothetical protein